MNDCKSTIGLNLRDLLKKHDDLSLSELSRLTTIPQPTLHHLLSGATKKPRKPVLEKLAHFFSIPIHQLTGKNPVHEENIKQVDEGSMISTIPLIRRDMLSDWPNAYGLADFKTILLDRDVGHDSFALTMKDANLEPLFPENAILIFDGNKVPQDREFVIVHFAKNNAIELNRLFIDQSNLYIKKEQPDGNIQLLKINSQEDKIIGTLIEVRLQF